MILTRKKNILNNRISNRGGLPGSAISVYCYHENTLESLLINLFLFEIFIYKLIQSSTQVVVAPNITASRDKTVCCTSHQHPCLILIESCS